MASGDKKTDSDKDKVSRNDGKREKSASRDDYARKMWQEIEGKASSKAKRQGLREEVKDSGQGNRKRRRRKRHKSKEPDSPFSSPVEAPEATKLPESAVEPVKPPALPVKPVSPFVPDSSLPPNQYEGNKKEDLEPADQGDQAVDEIFSEKAGPQSESDTPPINPFAPIEPAKPSGEKVGFDKPLDQFAPPEPETTAREEDERVVEKSDETKEVHSPDVEGLPDEVGPEDQRGEQDEVKAEDEIIEAEVKERRPDLHEEAIPGRVDAFENKGPSSAEQVEEFREDFWDILEHAGISKKRLVIIVVVILLLVSGILAFLFGWFGGGEDGEPVADKVSLEPGAVSGDEAYDIVASYIFGHEFTPIEAVPIGFYGDVSGINAAFVFGETMDFREEQFIDYVNLLRKMQNIYEVDIYSLVNLAVDRREALNEHLQEMDSLIREAEAALIVIDDSLASMDLEYESVTIQRDSYEQEFFNSLNTFYGESSEQFLDLFIENNQKAVELQARFNAFAALNKMFTNALNLLKPRYSDIEANQEALIKGIRVFDIPSSDIDAIIPLQ